MDRVNRKWLAGRIMGQYVYIGTAVGAVFASYYLGKGLRMNIGIKILGVAVIAYLVYISWSRISTMLEIIKD